MSLKMSPNSNSNFRHGQLEENIKEVENALKLRNLSKTRWTNRAESMHAVWTSYEVIMNTFQNSGNFDNSAKVTARSLCNKMMSI